MHPVILVMIGGALGAAARYQFGHWAGNLWGTGWPWGTLGVNLIGGFLMGILGALVAARVIAEPGRALLGVGVLGGFTTFSAFSLEMIGMIETGRPSAALAYALASVIGAVCAVWLGLILTRAVL